MALAAGSKLGPYEIVAPLGAGGMGEVYRARDTRLERTVAIKILPAHLSSDPVRKQRFEREAKTISSLNHPHICVLHDVGHQDGIDYLVMECVEGETLAKRLEKGPLPLEQVLKFGAQVADALDKAHRSGVVHRDLKPGNIMLTATGAKLLDFGLAKPTAPLSSVASLTAAVTQDSPMTQEGTIVGTFQYMSPEQVEGKELDGRSDIFSLGAVLYEMVTGKKAFEGKSQLSVASAILEKEPEPISAVKPMTPPALDHAIKKCLAKLLDERWQSAADLASELKWIGEAGSQALVAGGGVSGKRKMQGLGWSVAGLLGAAMLAGTVVWKLRPAERVEQNHVARFTIALLAGQRMAPGVSRYNLLAMSQDGSALVYLARVGDGPRQIFLRAMDSSEAKPIAGTEGASEPFFSPNGQWVGFTAERKLKRVAVTGGAPIAVCDVGEMQGATWSNDDNIFLGVPGSGIFRVAATGGSLERVTSLDTRAGETDHWAPNVLPGNKAIVYTAWSGYSQPKIIAQSLKTGERHALLEGISPRYVRSGHLVFARAGVLWAVPFAAERLEVTGAAVPLVQDIHMEYGVNPYFSVADDGTLGYLRGGILSAKQLVWVDRKGAVQQVAAPPRAYEIPRLSPNGREVALVIRGENHDVWTYDLERGALSRLTFEPGEDETPSWMPDGKSVVFAGDRARGSALLRKRADGSSPEEELLGTQGGHRHADSVSPDGRALVFNENGLDTTDDIWVMSLQGERTPRPFLKTRFVEIGAIFSPDGRWITYMSDESGRPEIYAVSYPEGVGKVQVSTEGGVEPVWPRKGHELFYRDGNKMMAVDVTLKGGLKAGQPRVLFEGRFENLPWAANYDVSADGQRFLMIQGAESTTGAGQIDIVLNWAEELKRRVPTGKSP